MKRVAIIIFTLLSILNIISARDEIGLHVWPLKELRRVMPGERPPLKRDGAVRLSLARNEWECFQLLFRLESRADIQVESISLEGLEVELKVYRQHRIYLDGKTEARPDYYPEPLIPAFHPLDGTLLKPTGKGKVYRAFPYRLPHGETEGYLIDIYVPAHLKSGIYRGELKISLSERRSGTKGGRRESELALPVELEIYNFTLPPVSSLRSWFWEPERQVRGLDYQRSHELERVSPNRGEARALEREYYDFEEDDYDYRKGKFDDDFTYWQEISDQLNELVRRHGITVSPPLYSFYLNREGLEEREFSFSEKDFSISSPHIKEDSLVSYLANFIKSNRVNTMVVPFSGMPSVDEVLEADFNYLWGYPKAVLPEELDEEDFRRQDDELDERLLFLKNYLLSLDRFIGKVKGAGGGGVEYFIYLYDEPGLEEHYTYIRAVGGFIKRLSLRHIKTMVVAEPEPPAGIKPLYRAFDIRTVPFRNFSAERMVQLRKRRAEGEIIWSYTALKNGEVPNWNIDAPLVSYRAPLWLNWIDGVEGLLYWSMALWGETGFMANPWEEQVSFVSQGRGFNGEGRLLYPAYVKSVGYKGAVPTLSLKSLREGLEDYEYLALLERERAKLVGRVKKSLLSGPLPSWSGWSREAVDYELARTTLAGAILYGNVLPLGPFRLPGRVECEDYHTIIDGTIGNEGALYRAGDGDLYYSPGEKSHFLRLEAGERAAYGVSSAIKGKFSLLVKGRGTKKDSLLKVELLAENGKTLFSGHLRADGEKEFLLKEAGKLELERASYQLRLTTVKGEFELDSLEFAVVRSDLD